MDINLSEKLHELGNTRSSLSKREVTALSDLDAAAVEPFQSVWPTIDLERRIEIVRAMQAMAEDNVDLDFRQFFLLCLDDTNPTIRATAVDGLWEDERLTTLRRLLELTNDPAPEVRVATMISLSRFAYLAVMGDLPASESQSVSTTLLTTISNTTQPLEVQRRAVEALGYFAETPEAQAAISRTYAHQDQSMRESAMVAMGRSMLPTWVPTIERELQSTTPALRYEAARAVGEFAEDGRAMLSSLLPLVSDDDIEVALAAIWALGQVGGPEAQQALERLVGSQDAVRREAASEALDELMLDSF